MENATATNPQAAEIIDIQALIEHRKQIVKQREEAERQLKDLDKHKPEFVKAARETVESILRSLGLALVEVFPELSKQAAKPEHKTDTQTQTNGDDGSKKKKSSSARPPAIWDYVKHDGTDGFAKHGKGGRIPQWATSDGSGFKTKIDYSKFRDATPEEHQKSLDLRAAWEAKHPKQ